MKLSRKQILTINLVNNIPLAVVISTVAPLVAHIKTSPVNWLTNVLLAFVFACLISLTIPIPRIAFKIPSLFHVNPKNIAGRLIANIPINFIYVVIIGLVLNFYNVRAVPDFLFAFIGTFLPLYVIAYIVSLITNIIAEKLAFGSAKQTRSTDLRS
ncbi:hypothetical protein ACFQ5M_07830 [Agrilactobacillus yilanensis]|uniref:DUF2798 domain-containing protein n=1 Tax=Agrilactobacillus yilanensis TaxID=2485997 RepID=A0ABW4J7T5_9LACO|nr:hypothetical protein [Agrilactobacillus yilanensis]